MDVKFVRAAAHYAGWDVLEKKDGFFYCGFGDWHLDVNCDLFKSVMYPLLLQRAIEGVNIKNGNFAIMQGNFGVNVLSFCSVPCLDNNSISDKAKEQALRYIYEQELEQS